MRQSLCGIARQLKRIDNKRRQQSSNKIDWIGARHGGDNN